MSEPRSDPRLLLLPALILALLLAALWGWFVPRATAAAPLPPSFGAWDFHNYFLPRFVFGTQELLAGRLPLWNRLEFAGLPFLATLQPAALYPPKIAAFALFGPEAAMQAFLVAHYALLIGSFLLFLRGQAVVGVGALAGSAFIAFNSLVLGSDLHPARVACFAWTPLIFWLADRAAKTRRRAPLAALALAVAMQLLVGYPEFTLHTALLLGVQAIAMRAIGAWPGPLWRTLPRLALAFALAAMLAGLQLAPFAELAVESRRAAAAHAYLTQTPPMFETSGWLAKLVSKELVYFGGLLVFWVAALPWRRSVPAFACLVVALLMGSHGWLLLRELPGLSGIRHPLMWVITLQFPIAWVVAIGCDAFARSSRGSARDRFGAWSVAGLAALWAVLCVLAGWIEPASPALQAILSGVPRGALARTLEATGAALILASLWLVRARRDLALVAGCTLAALGQIAQYSLTAEVSPFRPFEAPIRLGTLLPSAAPPIEGRLFSIEDMRWGYTFYDRVESLFGLETSVPPDRFRALQQRLGFEANWHLLDWRAFGAAEGFLDALDVEYVVASLLDAGALPEASWERAPQNRGDVALLRNRERPGRAWVAYGASVAASEPAALERLLAPDFDPRREVILEAPLASFPPAPASEPHTPARVQVVSPTRVEVEAELPRPGMLVLSEAWFPGWVASLDGAPAEILRADYVLRGIALGAGSHRVRFDYRPVSVRIGAALSVAGIVAIVALLGSDWRRTLSQARARR